MNLPSNFSSSSITTFFSQTTLPRTFSGISSPCHSFHTGDCYLPGLSNHSFEHSSYSIHSSIGYSRSLRPLSLRGLRNQFISDYTSTALTPQYNWRNQFEVNQLVLVATSAFDLRLKQFDRIREIVGLRILTENEVHSACAGRHCWHSNSSLSCAPPTSTSEEGCSHPGGFCDCT